MDAMESLNAFLGHWLPWIWVALAVAAALLWAAKLLLRSPGAARSLPTLFAWLLWAWTALVVYGAFYYAPPAKGFIGESSRILFFHVPMAWVSFVAFMAAGVWSALYLFGPRRDGRRDPRHDRAANAAVQLGLVFGVLATTTGSLWARIMWGAYWNWDPRQTSVVLALLFYAAYLALRISVEDAEARGRLAAAYAVLGLVVAPSLFFVLPRMAAVTLHPDSVINTRGTVDMDSRMVQVLLAGSAAFTALFFWVHHLQCRLQALWDRKERLA
jgi:heme exporter protein C